MNNDRFNKWFNAFILIGMTVAMILTTAISLKTADSGKAMLIIAAFGSLMGVLCNVCSANGNIWTFLFGLFDVSIYAVMCFIDGKYGNAALNGLYFLPMQFVGFFQWRKRGAGAGTELKARRFTPKQWLLYGAIFLAGSIVVYLILNIFDKSAAQSFIKVAVLTDAISTVCNLIGQLLLSMAYMEQWYFWIGVTVFPIVMWAASLAGPADSYALVLVVKYAFFLLNSLNGLRIWINLSRERADLQI